MNQKVDLVTDNYYEKTLVYQTQIDEAERTKEINKEIKLEYLNNQLKFVFPDSVVGKMSGGEIYFYRPSDSSKDFKSTFQLDENGELLLEASQIERGYWKVQMRWLMNGESYSVERAVMIN
jgi:nitrogen fixation protein FixH